jgi:hypothetical protein
MLLIKFGKRKAKLITLKSYAQREEVKETKAREQRIKYNEKIIDIINHTNALRIS